MFFLSQTCDKETIHPIILRQELDEWTGLIESAESTDVFCLVFLMILHAFRHADGRESFLPALKLGESHFDRR